MRKALCRTLAVLLILLITVYAGSAEQAGMPSPEPPAARVTRPTPEPTAVPTEIITDQIHFPEKCPGFSFQKDKKLLEIWFPNIRDADEAILIYDGDIWMIDCGDERAGDRGARLMRQLQIDHIDILFNSHLHHDHINGLWLTNKEAAVREIRICFPPEMTESGKRMLQNAEKMEIPVKEYQDGDRFAMGDGAVELLFLKNNEEGLDINNQSAVTRVSYGRSTILFTADMEQPGQEAMINRVGPDLLKCDIVKYPHHAKSDLYEPFFEAMDAKLAIVTSVEGRQDAGQAALAERGLPAVYTAKEGLFTHLVTDGEYWLCEQVPITVR